MPPKAASGFTQEDRNVMNKLLQNVKSLSKEITGLKACLKEAKKVICDQNNVINNVYKDINTSNYRIDSQRQYNCREAMRVHGITDDLGSDAEKIVQEIAAIIENKTKGTYKESGEKGDVTINLNPDTDIQRCHFLGKRKKKIICRFVSHKQRMKFLRNKRIINSMTKGKFKNIFIAEDLTPMRARLIWYINNELKGSFCNVHTLNGTIKMKRHENDKDWLVVNNPDDLFKHLRDGETFDLDLFNEGLHDFEILQHRAPVTLAFNEFLDDDE